MNEHRPPAALPPDTLDVWTAPTRRNADSLTARKIVGGYLDLHHDDVCVVRSSTGKPILDPTVHGDGLHFSVSHARGTLVVAVAHRPLGVDIESTLDLASRPLDGVIRYLTPNEQATLAAIDERDRPLAMLICWTRKEAYSKADGRGLSIGFDRFEVSCAPGAPPALLRCDDPPGAADRWVLLDLPRIDGIVGTIAVEAPAPARVRLRRWFENS